MKKDNLTQWSIDANTKTLPLLQTYFYITAVAMFASNCLKRHSIKVESEQISKLKQACPIRISFNQPSAFMPSYVNRRAKVLQRHISVGVRKVLYECKYEQWHPLWFSGLQQAGFSLFVIQDASHTKRCFTVLFLCDNTILFMPLQS